jgi:DNA-binding MarR family transcriptional regulator
MKKAKEPLPPPSPRQLKSAAKCLANETSLTILKFLNISGFGLSSSIIKATGYHQSTISKQMKSLHALGLVKKERLRTCNIFSVNKDRFKYLGISIEVWLDE